MKPFRQEVHHALWQDYHESYYDQPLLYPDIVKIVEDAKRDGSILSTFSVKLDQDHSDRAKDREYVHVTDLEALFGQAEHDIHQISFNSRLGEEPVVSHLITPKAGYYNKMVFNKDTVQYITQKKKEEQS